MRVDNCHPRPEDGSRVATELARRGVVVEPAVEQNEHRPLAAEPHVQAERYLLRTLAVRWAACWLWALDVTAGRAPSHVPGAGQGAGTAHLSPHWPRASPTRLTWTSSGDRPRGVSSCTRPHTPLHMSKSGGPLFRCSLVGLRSIAFAAEPAMRTVSHNYQEPVFVFPQPHTSTPRCRNGLSVLCVSATPD